MLSKLDDTALEEVARYFAALSVPMRLKILNALRDGERNVGDLTQITGCTQANVSKHLQALYAARFVQRRKEGLFTYYSLADRDVFKLCDLMCGRLERELRGQRKALSAS